MLNILLNHQVYLSRPNSYRKDTYFFCLIKK